MIAEPRISQSPATSAPAPLRPAESPDARTKSRLSPLHDLSILLKLRLSSLVLVTAALGFVDGRSVIAPTSASLTLETIGAFLAAMLGTALAAFGANALNQWAERDLDAKMNRTKDRPLPAGRMAPRTAFAIGVFLVVAGVATLAVFTNALATSLAAASALIYVLLYTPLKRTTPHSTLIGTIPGALPPVIGYVAAAGSLDWNAAFLFAVLTFWQLPHFYAISRLYREDYARAGYPMLAVIDRDGRRLGRSAVVHLVLLVVVSLLPLLLRDLASIRGATIFYGSAALLFGGVFLASGIAFARKRDDASARRLFHWSLLYLPALLLALVKDTL